MLTQRQNQAVGPRPTEALSDGDLIGRSLANPACFAVIFDRHADEILRYAHARLGPDLAEDVVAETFLAAFSRRDRYDTARADARPWLYGIAVYPTTGSYVAPAPVQQAVVTRVVTAAGTDIEALYVIHPSAMPAGSVLLIQGVAIGGQGPRAAAEVSELASFPAPAVLASDSLPPGCTWQVVARFPFRLIQGQGSTK